MSDILISARNLKRHYVQGENVIKALDGVSVDIRAGEYVAIMGPSGSGKSTFMNQLGALDVPSDGALLLAGENLADLDKDDLADLRNRVIGFVFQQFNLLPRTSALKNAILPMLYSRNAPDDLTERGMEALSSVGLADRHDHKPNQLSGGQQQRVAVARALVNRPSLILADEPTGALDSKTSEEIMKLFQDLNAEGLTIIMVTHDAHVAAHAKRVIHFEDGHVLADETQEPIAPGTPRSETLGRYEHSLRETGS